MKTSQCLLFELKKTDKQAFPNSQRNRNKFKYSLNITKYSFNQSTKSLNQ